LKRLWVGIALAAGTARAEDGVDAHGFAFGPIEPDLRDPIGWVRPGAYWGGDVYAGLVAEYVRRPLVAVTTSETQGPLFQTAVIRDLATFDVLAGFTAHKRVRVDVAFPLHLLSYGAVDGLKGPAPGDVRATVSGVFLRPEETVGGGGIGVGGSIWVDAPSGSPDRFLGRGGLGGGGRATLTMEAPIATFNAHLGLQFDPKVAVANLTGTDQLTAGLGVALSASDHVGIGLEASGALGLSRNDVRGAASPAEAVLSFRVLPEGAPPVVFGVGRALTRGVGAPDLRAFAAVAFGKWRPLREIDVDPVGVVETTDTCPAEAEVRNGWKDDDGCPDRLSAVSTEVVFEGQPRPGAHLAIEGLPEAWQKTWRPGTPPVEVMPETVLVGRASSDGCLQGDTRITATEGDVALRVELSRVLDARVTVLVEDMNGHPLPNAAVTWLSDTPLCVPGQEVTTNAQGRVAMGIGAGQHQLVVAAAGYDTVFSGVEFSAGEERTLAVALSPEVVEVEAPEEALVRLEAERIAILEKVHFETAKAVIKPESFELLDQVAQVVIDHPDVGRVEIAGHTDNRGSDSYNLDLSQRRADAVRAYLIRQGVPEERLVATGYGETRPIDPTDSDAAFEANRRVDFDLIDQRDDGAAPEPAP
jgi:outer membrane protein OmpA-like peptidoglycan-associated protein